jgi:4-hydroxy-tetrahydrodipicolinate reductase
MNLPKPIKVAQFGLGPIGISSLRLLAQKNWVEIVGGIDIRPELIGKPLAEIVGDASIGDAKVYESFEELILLNEVDAVVHTAGSRATVSFEQIRPMLEKGIAVVSSCEELLYPALRAPKETEEIDQLCQATGGRVLGTGVNPGFVLDVMPAFFSGVCASVSGVYGERVVNASTRRQPLQKKIGSGMDPEVFKALAAEGKAGHAGFKESLALLANALGWELGSITETIAPVIAQKPIRTEFFTVDPGQTAGLHQIVKAETNEGYKIHLDLKMYLDADKPHDTIRLDSNPPIEATVTTGVAGDIATVAALVNAIPSLLEAPAGVRLMTDLCVPRCRQNLSSTRVAAELTT